jgi:hypothetical protein
MYPVSAVTLHAVCYSLNMQYLPQAHVLNASSPAGGAILGGSGNFREWGLVGGSRHGGVPLKVIPCLPVHHEVTSSSSTAIGQATMD